MKQLERHLAVFINYAPLPMEKLVSMSICEALQTRTAVSTEKISQWRGCCSTHSGWKKVHSGTVRESMRVCARLHAEAREEEVPLHHSTKS